MRILVKLLLTIFSGYVAVLLTVSVLWSVVSLGEFSRGGIIYTIWLTTIYAFHPSSYTIVAHSVLVILAMFAFVLRHKPRWHHIAFATAAGAVVGAIIICLWATIAGSSPARLSFLIVPFATAALAMSSCIRILFAQPPLDRSQDDIARMGASERRITIATSVCMVSAIFALMTWFFYEQRERKIWDRVEDNLRRAVLTDERFRYVRMHRANDGSIFLYGGVESSAVLDDLRAAVERAKPERTPKIVVTVSERAFALDSGTIRTRRVQP